MFIFILVCCLVFALFILPSLPYPEPSSKELFDKYGESYLRSLEQKIKEKDKIIKTKEDTYDYLKRKINTCVLIFEEYFAQDQTNDDLLVTAFEQLHLISDLATEGFCLDDDKRRILRKGLSVINLEFKKLGQKSSII